MRAKIRKVLLESMLFEPRPNINDAFWSWFKDSKVVDSNGNPLIVYHGSPVDKDFSVFRTETSHGIVAFFSDNVEMAEGYATVVLDQDGRIIPAFLSVQNPFYPEQGRQEALNFWYHGNTLERFWLERLAADYYDAIPEEISEEQVDEFGAEEFAELVVKGSWVALEVDDFVEFIRKRKYDGIITRELGYHNWGVFKSSQVKSVFNRGTWSPNSQDIMK